MGPEFLDKPLADALRANGLAADVGPALGYVLRFSNGLVAYLSGDTGITAEQEITVRRYYKANLVVMNMGGSPFSTGPAESAFIVNELVRPASVIASRCRCLRMRRRSAATSRSSRIRCSRSRRRS